MQAKHRCQQNIPIIVATDYPWVVQKTIVSLPFT
jgi:hypothetical protein